MSVFKSPLKLTICRVCLRDNPGLGPWTDETTLKCEFKRQLGSTWFRPLAEIDFQNCFAQCENFYCVQVTAWGSGYLLKQISTPEKIQALVRWIRAAQNHQGVLKISDELAEQVIAPVEFVDQT